MLATSFIAGDWGTTHLRLFLCDSAGAKLEMKTGPGAAQTRGDFAGVFDTLTQDWIARLGPMRAVLSGMAGSRIGWRETSYLPIPVDPEQIASGCVALRGGAIRIVPGLSCRNRLGAPDLMRGEETQVLGALQFDPALHRGRHLLCLPGTHTKWVLIEEGTIASFLTVPAGDLFDSISRHSVLVDAASRFAIDQAAFERGLSEFNRHRHVQLLSLIFQCRSRWMTGDLEGEATASFLSGLLIACDIASAMDLFAQEPVQQIHVIGSSNLNTLYAKGFEQLDRDCHSIDGEAAAVAGLTLLYQLTSSSHEN